MEYRFLGKSGLQISRLTLGTMTFGGRDLFAHVGNQTVAEAKEMIGLCLEAGVNTFDTADMYSKGVSEEVLGKAIGSRRDSVIIATKAFFRMGDGIHDMGLSRLHLIRACEASLKRLGTDYIDLYQLHNFDALTPLEETLSALDLLIRQGKVRYTGCSNFCGWQLMKTLSISERRGFEPLIAQQVHYALTSRELESELIPLSLDQNVGILVWSPLAFGLLSGKFRRDKKPDKTRLTHLNAPGNIDWERLYSIVDVLEEIARARGKSIPQVALNWLLRRPGITSVIIGARDMAQLKDNLGAVGWALSEEEVRRLEKVSDVPEAYPYWHQHSWGSERNPQIQRNYCE